MRYSILLYLLPDSLQASIECSNIVIGYQALGQSKQPNPLAKILNRTRSKSYHENKSNSKPQSQFLQSRYVSRNNSSIKLKANKRIIQGYEDMKQSQMRKTNFINSYMDKLKKQRKRKEKKKLSNLQCTKQLKNNSQFQSMYIFLPTLNKITAATKDYPTNRVSSMLKTINLFQGNYKSQKAKMKKSKTFSSDQKIILPSKSSKKLINDDQVKQLITQIKSSRKKVNKSKIQKIFKGADDQTALLLQNSKQMNSIYTLPSIQIMENSTSRDHIKKTALQATTLNSINYRQAAFTGKKIDPWHSQTDNHFISQQHGIESFQFA